MQFNVRLLERVLMSIACTEHQKVAGEHKSTGRSVAARFFCLDRGSEFVAQCELHHARRC